MWWERMVLGEAGGCQPPEGRAWGRSLLGDSLSTHPTPHPLPSVLDCSPILSSFQVILLEHIIMCRLVTGHKATALQEVRPPGGTPPQGGKATGSGWLQLARSWGSSRGRL